MVGVRPLFSAAVISASASEWESVHRPESESSRSNVEALLGVTSDKRFRSAFIFSIEYEVCVEALVELVVCAAFLPDEGLFTDGTNFSSSLHTSPLLPQPISSFDDLSLRAIGCPFVALLPFLPDLSFLPLLLRIPRNDSSRLRNDLSVNHQAKV